MNTFIFFTMRSMIPILQSQEPLTEEERRKLKERRRFEQEKEERERMQVLVSNFTEGQLDRYEMFRRAAFPKASIKRVMQQITGEYTIASYTGRIMLQFHRKI